MLLNFSGRWYEFLGGIGASSIVLAECITVIDRFLKPEDADFYLLGANYSIQALFYFGNFLISLSVLDGPNVIWPMEKADQSQR